MLERTVGQLHSKSVGARNIRRKVALDSAGTRRVMAGSRMMNGKRYAFEAEAVACITGQGVVDADLHATSSVLDRVQEMLHKSLAAYAQRGAEPASGNLPEDVAETKLGAQDYSGLLDCVIADQRGADLPGYLLDLAENLPLEIGQAAKVRGRLVFVVTGQMIEADIEGVDLSSAE